MLELQNIQGGYQNNTDVLKGIDLTLKKGEVVAVLGQNGSGKSTLAKAVLNLLEVKTGIVIWKNKDISNLPTHQFPSLGIGSTLQGGEIFPNLTIKEHLILAGDKKLLLLKDSFFQALWAQKDKKAGLLSGGERSLLALAMVLAQQPDLILLDEPTAGLSPRAIQDIYRVLQNLKDKGVSLLLIEQNIQQALTLACRVVVLKNGVLAETLENKNPDTTLRKLEEIFF